MLTDLQNWIESEFEGHVALLKRFAAIPAPSHDEGRRVEFLLRYFKDLCVRAYEDAAKNVLVPMGCDGADDITLVSAHTDVVFPDTVELPIIERDGKLIGPGVGDDSANAAAILSIIKFIKQNGLTPGRPLLFALNSCEEGLGNLKGIKQIMRDFSGRIARCVSFDCHFESGIITRAVGSVRWRVVCKTRGGHSYGDFGSANAIHRMAQLISRLYEQRLPVEESADTDSPAAVCTFNVGTISGGTSVNTIASSCEMLYECRSDDRDALDSMSKSFYDILGAAQSPDAEFSCELIGKRPCGSRSGDAGARSLQLLCAESYRAVMGAEPKLSSGSTDANVPISLGIPALTFGLYSGGGMHTREEWLDIASLKKGLEIGLLTVLRLCFADS